MASLPRGLSGCRGALPVRIILEAEAGDRWDGIREGGGPD